MNFYRDTDHAYYGSFMEGRILIKVAPDKVANFIKSVWKATGQTFESLKSAFPEVTKADNYVTLFDEIMEVYPNREKETWDNIGDHGAIEESDLTWTEKIEFDAFCRRNKRMVTQLLVKNFKEGGCIVVQSKDKTAGGLIKR